MKTGAITDMLRVLNRYYISMPKELAKQYKPGKVEDAIYQKWEESGYFNPDNLPCDDDAPTYTIILPPPNITDKLHLGHAAMLAIEDLLIRYHRMKGERVLWLPGTDHAAIATQNVVEKRIHKETDKTRHDLGREKFLDEVWKFVKVTQETILHQTRKMGASLDWSREAFTLDEKRQKAVAQMFVDMYNDDIIYRGERIVNWCTRCHSTLADDEVEYTAQKAKLYTFTYDKNFPIAISTTRPETKLGDSAIAVNPKDQRYKKYIGKELTAVFCGVPLSIKVIADHEVDMAFGTGALGVTPAHSMVDWNMAEKNDLAIIKVINEKGLIHDGFKQFSTMTAIAAREAIVAELKKENLITEEEEIENNLSVCYRCDTAIEPLPSEQWFISVDKKIERLNGRSLKECAVDAAKTEELTFVPDRFTKRYCDWMSNLHDWCISRQIWFGHRIPVWHKDDEIYCGTTPPEGDGWQQDPDTLDTWFSSGMWTFSTLGWPDTFKNNKKSGDLARFHPTQVLETGYEILTLWVSRMVMMSYFAIGEIPFEKVHLHGMILDDKGKKMSKSKGNGIDPIDMIDQFGTDAVRLSLLIGNTPGNDMRLDEEKIERYRNFTNKLWNIGRYVFSASTTKTLDTDWEAQSAADRWIIKNLNHVIVIVSKNIENHNLSQAGEILRDFTWNEFADWYVETHKVAKNDALLLHIYTTLLRLWHPFMPFVTEQLWQEIYDGNRMLMVEKYPIVDPHTKEDVDEKNFEKIKDLITKVRNIRAIYKVDQGIAIPLTVVTEKEELITTHNELIKRLARVNTITILHSDEKQKHAASATLTDMKLYVHLEGIIDIAKEQKRLTDESMQTQNYINSIEKRLSNEQFVSKAPKKVVTTEKENLATAQKKLSELKKHIDQITF